MLTVDKFDLQILAALQKDGKCAHGVLSESVHLSTSQISRRIQRLEEAGVIDYYAAVLEPSVVELGVLAFTYVSLERHGRSQGGAALEQQIQDFPEVLECFSVTGEADYILRIVARDLESFSEFMMQRLMRVPGVQMVKSNIALKRIKQTHALPLEHLTEPRAEKRTIKFNARGLE